MDVPANLLLSDKELAMVSDDSWIKMKEGILAKSAQLLSLFPPEIKRIFVKHLTSFSEVSVTSPKISRGERYRGLPYLILDYPREFGRTDTFALRTMFWWAHDFTVSLLLSGRYRARFEEKVIGNLAASPGLLIATGEDPWQHDTNGDGYLPVNNLTKDELKAALDQLPFLKITCTVPIVKWNEAEKEILRCYEVVATLFS